MTNLVAAYQRNDILEFEKILKVWTFSMSAFSNNCEHGDSFCQYDTLSNLKGYCPPEMNSIIKN